MRFVYVALMIAILGGAVYLLYRSIWKHRGQCPDCTETHKIKKKIWKDDGKEG